MVNKNLNSNYDINFMPEPLKYNFISLSEVYSNNLRLEANSFNFEAKDSKAKIMNNRYGAVNLWSDKGFVHSASRPGRSKNIYASKEKGEPFYLPSQIIEVKPKPSKFVSANNYKKENLIEHNTLLITCSGTIGKVTIASRSNINKLYSSDLIRVKFHDEIDIGYCYAYLKTKEGSLILQVNNYGAVIKHIDPEHLQNLLVPNAPAKLKKSIHNDVCESYDFRDESNDLIDKAEAMLYEELQLEPVEELKPTYFSSKEKLRNFSMKLSQLNLRLDVSCHVPIANLVEKALEKHSQEIITIGDLAERVILAGIFKRHYVQKENGVPFLGGKDITQLNPDVEKYLSKVFHKDRIKKELEVFENYVLISDRGTVGKVQIVPKHWNGWTVSQNVIKIIPISDDFAGYIYCFLNSDYGQILIEREIYGSVINMIDDNKVANIKIPILKNKDRQKEINDLVLEANNLRYKAYLKEQSAIKKMEDIINDVV